MRIAMGSTAIRRTAFRRITFKNGAFKTGALKSMRGLVRRRLGGSPRLLVTGTVVAVVLASVGFAAGHGSVPWQIHSNAGAAWLPSTASGSVSLIDGQTGRADGELVLSGSQGHPLVVSEDGPTVLVRDPATGVLIRIDTSQLTVGAAVETPAGSTVVSGPTATYLVDYTTGSVERIDPVSLRGLSPAYFVNGQLGQAVVDGTGTLWLPVRSAGTVVPVTTAGVGTPVKASPPGADLALTVAGGQPMVIDRTSGRVMTLGPGGVGGAITLPVPAAGTPSNPLLPAASSTTTGSVPILDPAGKPNLLLINAASGAVNSVPLGAGVAGDQFGAPVQAGNRVFVPDFSHGTALVYDTATATMGPAVTVTGMPGSFGSQVVDGIAYFNNPGGADAVAVTPDGQAHTIIKTGPGVPSNAQAATSTPSAALAPSDLTPAKASPPAAVTPDTRAPAPVTHVAPVVPNTTHRVVAPAIRAAAPTTPTPTPAPPTPAPPIPAPPTPTPTPTASSTTPAPVSGGTVTPALLGAPDFNGYCQSTGNGSAQLAANNAYGWQCSGAGGTQEDVQAVCQWTYHTTSVTSRVSNWNDPNTWQCWAANRELGPLDFNTYCKDAGYSGVQYVNGRDAYGWFCNGDSNGIDSQAACLTLYGSNPPISRFTNYYDKNSWQCWG